MTNQLLYKTLLLLTFVWLSGCAKFDIRKNIPWGEGADGAIERPMRVTASWTDSIMTRNDQPAQRGFGGRLYFFGANPDQPVKVEGTLVIYAFDETNRDPTNVVPDRKVVYPIADFAKLQSKSKMGHSYSVWVPWDVVGGPRKEISLIARFIPKDSKGGVILSEQAKLLLPGTEPLVKIAPLQSFEQSTIVHENAAPAPWNGATPPPAYGQQSAAPPTNTAQSGNTAQQENTVQQASYQEAVPASGESGTDSTRTRMKTSTIPLHGPQAARFMQQQSPGQPTNSPSAADNAALEQLQRSAQQQNTSADGYKTSVRYGAPPQQNNGAEHTGDQQQGLQKSGGQNSAPQRYPNQVQPAQYSNAAQGSNLPSGNRLGTNFRGQLRGGSEGQAQPLQSDQGLVSDQAEPPAVQPTTHSPRSRFQVPRVQVARPQTGRERWQQHPAVSQSGQ
ncbi:MAG: hypothetical protein SGJ20_21635 [Planctomycetota bacterium]|nr:hypothetical protein [Planctomycetota bacterium]